MKFFNVITLLWNFLVDHLKNILFTPFEENYESEAISDITSNTLSYLQKQLFYNNYRFYIK